MKTTMQAIFLLPFVSSATDAVTATWANRIRRPVKSGRLAEPLPVLPTGETKFVFSTADDAAAAVRIDMVKRYIQGVSK